MVYFAGLERFTIMDHGEEVLTEVSRLRLEKRLRKSRQPYPERRFALTFRRVRPLPR